MNEDEKQDGDPVGTAATQLLQALGIEPDDSFREQVEVFAEALRIYANRRARYGDAWKQYGWMDSLFHMRNKMTRTDAEYWRSVPEDYEQALARLDNPYDLINYTAFFIRNVIDGNERGEN